MQPARTGAGALNTRTHARTHRPIGARGSLARSADQAQRSHVGRGRSAGSSSQRRGPLLAEERTPPLRRICSGGAEGLPGAVCGLRIPSVAASGMVMPASGD